MDIQHPPRQLCIIRGPPADAGVYECGVGCAEGDCQDEVFGEDGAAGWEAAGEGGLRGVGGVW